MYMIAQVLAGFFSWNIACLEIRKVIQMAVSSLFAATKLDKSYFKVFILN
jgi:hypothetical protein